jgi:hypothetical protein
MKLGKGTSILSHTINMMIFIYFSITLIQINALNIRGLFISAFGIFASLIANIISVIEETN